MHPGSVGVLTTDRALVVRSWDGWMADATGIPASSACGWPLGALFPEIEERGMLRPLRRAAEEGAVQVLAPAFHRYLIPCPPREPSPYFARMQQHVTVTPLRSGEEIVGVVVRVEDVTARREEEHRLAEQLRSGGEAARLRAVEALSASESAPEVLLGAFGDPSWRVRRIAAAAVARQEGEAAVEALTRALREQHRDFSVLNATLSALAASGADVLPRLVELLESPDTDLRIYVALALGHLGRHEAVPALVRALADESPNVRVHALEALGRLRARAATPTVLEVAESRDFYLAFAALDALGAIGDETAAPRLLPLLDDELLRPAAVEVLGRIGREDAVAPLAHLLAHEEVPAAEPAGALAALFARFEEAHRQGDLVRALVRAALPRAGADRLRDALAAAPEEEWPPLVRVLSWLDAEGVEAPLLRALGHPRARQVAVEGLVRRGARAVERIVPALDGLEEEARRGAVVALGRIGSPAVVPELLRFLDADPETVVVTAAALGSIGDPRAFAPLLELLDSPEAAVRQAAIGALCSIGHPGMPPRVRELLDSPSPRVRESAARIAGYFGYPGCFEPLLALCGDPEESVRRAAVEQLVYFEDRRVPDALREALREGGPSVRAAAARALGRVSPAEGAALLEVALGDRDLWVRYYAARSAAALSLPDLAAPLCGLAAHDPAVPVRIAAIQALGRLRAPEAVSALAPLAGHADPEVSGAALAALGGIEHADALPPLAATLRSGDAERQRIVLEALSEGSAARLREEVAHAARTAGDPGVVRAAASALLRAGSPEAVIALCRMAADPLRCDPCIEVLSGAGERALPQLGEGLRTEREEIRGAIVSALGRMRHPAAQRLLAAALEDPAPAVRGAAAHALGRWDLRAVEPATAAEGPGGRPVDGTVRRARTG